MTHHHRRKRGAIIPQDQSKSKPQSVERLVVVHYNGKGRKNRAQQLRNGMRIPSAFVSFRLSDAKIPLLRSGQNEPTFVEAPPLLLQTAPAADSAVMGLVIAGEGGKRLLHWTPRNMWGNACGTYRVTAHTGDLEAPVKTWEYLGIFDLSKEWPRKSYSRGNICTHNGLTYTLTRIYGDGKELSPKTDPRIPLRCLETKWHRSAILPT